MSKKLGIVVSHPIQYYAPLFREIAKKIDLVVFYCHNPTSKEIGRQGFDKEITWDIDLLSGYKSVFLNNYSKKPAVDQFFGCKVDNLELKLKEEKITHLCIIGWYLYALWQAFFIGRKLGLIISQRGDTHYINTVSLQFILKKFLYPLFLNKYTTILYVGKRNLNYYKVLGIRKPNFLFSPHAIDQNQFLVKDQNKISSKIKYLWVGKMIPLKRIPLLIDAFSSISDDTITLDLIGDGPERTEIESLAKVDSRIKLLGFKNQTDLHHLYKNYDCLILPSDSETWGLVVNEAMAAGIPAIISDAVGCSDDLIERGKTGWIFKSENDESLKNAIIESIIDLRKNKEVIRASIEEKNKTYHFDTVVKSFQLFLQS